LVKATFGCRTDVLADADPPGAFDAVTVAVFGKLPEVAEVVPDTTCAVMLAPATREATLQVSDCDGGVPLIEQPDTALASDQEMPLPAGSGR